MLAELASAKKLDVAFLRSLRVSDSKSHGKAAGEALPRAEELEV